VKKDRGPSDQVMPIQLELVDKAIMRCVAVGLDLEWLGSCRNESSAAEPRYEHDA
jgi:hypothetical protein